MRPIIFMMKKLFPKKEGTDPHFVYPISANSRRPSEVCRAEMTREGCGKLLNMNETGEKVYHGSPSEFDSDHAIPRHNTRTNEEGEIIFNQESFHATPHKWVALAYTYKAKPIEIEGKTAHYGMGVDLYDGGKEIAIWGVGSLEESLKEMYGEGGYLYHFDTDKFIYKEGLGSREVITEEPTKPISVERVEDPVSELQSLGVTFRFFDLSLPENAEDIE